ncbi:MAG: GFA family protein [Hyphomicrobiales bacterium]
MKAALQCHCRECQYITGGNPNVVMIFGLDSFSYTQGKISDFARDDLENPVHRHFCSNCGTAIGSQSPSTPNAMIVKVGTLDDPSIFTANVAIYTCDQQEFHHIPEGVPAFDKRPPKK